MAERAGRKASHYKIDTRIPFNLNLTHKEVAPIERAAEEKETSVSAEARQRLNFAELMIQELRSGTKLFVQREGEGALTELTIVFL
ncbi:MAG: hypothetical protein NUV69_02805 [Candidatus Curtissbacteria bacterium]|nr:hypothetical protein [Candidatus Curtissbacteria bacterium]